MAKVFVTQADRRLNYTAAESYGEVTFLTSLEYPSEPTVSSFRKEVVEDMKNSFKDYIAGTDYIVTTGSAMPNVIVGMLLAGRGGLHNILKWNNRSKNYGLFKLRT